MDLLKLSSELQSPADELLDVAQDDNSEQQSDVEPVSHSPDPQLIADEHERNQLSHSPESRPAIDGRQPFVSMPCRIEVLIPSGSSVEREAALERFSEVGLQHLEGRHRNENRGHAGTDPFEWQEAAKSCNARNETEQKGFDPSQYTNLLSETLRNSGQENESHHQNQAHLSERLNVLEEQNQEYRERLAGQCRLMGKDLARLEHIKYHSDTLNEELERFYELRQEYEAVVDSGKQEDNTLMLLRVELEPLKAGLELVISVLGMKEVEPVGEDSSMGKGKGKQAESANSRPKCVSFAEQLLANSSDDLNSDEGFSSKDEQAEFNSSSAIARPSTIVHHKPSSSKEKQPEFNGSSPDAGPSNAHDVTVPDAADKEQDYFCQKAPEEGDEKREIWKKFRQTIIKVLYAILAKVSEPKGQDNQVSSTAGGDPNDGVPDTAAALQQEVNKNSYISIPPSFGGVPLQTVQQCVAAHILGVPDYVIAAMSKGCERLDTNGPTNEPEMRKRLALELLLDLPEMTLKGMLGQPEPPTATRWKFFAWPKIRRAFVWLNSLLAVILIVAILWTLAACFAADRERAMWLRADEMTRRVAVSEGSPAGLLWDAGWTGEQQGY